MADLKYYDVIKKPVLTEKSMNAMAEKKYTFLVHPDATKNQIADAVEKMFEGTKVAKVNTVNYDGKTKRLRNKPGKTASFKKAVVTIDTEGAEGSYTGKGGKAVKTGKKYKTSIEEFGFGQ